MKNILRIILFLVFSLLSSGCSLVYTTAVDQRDVKSVQCNVVLYGFVASENKIKKAIVHAKSVEGVRSVKSFLTSAN
jgi:osmotically-inducible protein OsmY